VLSAIGIVGASALIAVNSVPYFTGSADHPFLAERAQLAVDATWRAALVVHVTGGILCLAAGPVLLWNLVLRRSARLHRVLGHAYLVAVLAWAGPAGFVLAANAKGGFAGRSGFIVLALAWMTTTALGWREVRRRRLESHAVWMVRSYALAVSAVWFRLAQVAFLAAGVPDGTNYALSIWLSTAVSVVQGEFLAAQIRRHGRVRSLVFEGGSDEVRPAARRPVGLAVRWGSRRDRDVGRVAGGLARVLARPVGLAPAPVRFGVRAGTGSDDADDDRPRAVLRA
jgi:uncharacterized membrane protein